MITMLEIELTQFIPGLLLGLLGSMHCVGMCGPIALAIPHRRTNRIGHFAESMAYNLGRITTYATLGFILGFLGFGLQFIGLQSYISISLGVIILLAIILPKIFSQNKLTSKLNGKITRFIQPAIRRFMISKSVTSIFLLGVLNGLLPCGMVYFALAGSVASSNSIEGALFMAAFGLGTVPAMSALYIFKSSINLKFRNILYKAVPYGLALVATLMILRGLSLDIPYISPDIQGIYKSNDVQCLDDLSN